MGRKMFLALITVCAIVPLAVLALYCAPAEAGLFGGPPTIALKRNHHAPPHPKREPTYTDDYGWYIGNLSIGAGGRRHGRTSGAPRLRRGGW
jgi:hypothetical protein